MRLPNSHKAVVKIEKLRDYSLNPNHPVGKHKARVFQAALGTTLTEAEWLREHALEAAKRNLSRHLYSAIGM
jgi:ribosomal protein L16/L10AE